MGILDFDKRKLQPITLVQRSYIGGVIDDFTRPDGSAKRNDSCTG